MEFTLTKPKPSGPPSAASNLEKKTDKYILFSAAALIMGFVLWLAMYSLSKQQISDIQVTNQEIETTNISDQKLASLNQFVDANSQTIEEMFIFFPHEDNFIDTLESIESIVNKYDPEGVVILASQTPTAVNGQLHIPLEISLTTTLESLTKLLRELEKMPLLLEVSSISSTHTGSNALIISLGVNLYVDEPFSQPQTNPPN